MDAKLRPWALSDAVDLRRAATSNIDLISQFGDADFSIAETAQNFIENRLARNTTSHRNFAILTNERVVGNVGLTHIEHQHDTAWVSYWLADEARGNGLAFRSVACVADWAFNELELFRLELGHRVNNPASCVVAVRAGFAPEGVERQKLRYGNDRFDVETHSRLATDKRPTVESITIDTKS